MTAKIDSTNDGPGYYLVKEINIVQRMPTKVNKLIQLFRNWTVPVFQLSYDLIRKIKNEL